MKKINWTLILLMLNLAVISGVVIGYLNMRFPLVGNDHRGVASMLDSYIYFRLNGLSIQWFSPSFGGGLPAFPDPNNAQFSLLHLLLFLVSPWQAVMISTVIFIIIGGCGSFYFFHRLLNLHWTASILGMVFFIATGYYMERISAGHLAFQTFPLLVILIIALLDLSIPRGIAGVIFALVITIMINQGGFILIVTFGLSLLVIFPLLYLYRYEIISWKHLVSVAAIGLLVTLVMSASKVAAVFAFMRFFPRQLEDYYPGTSILRGLFGIVLQLLGTMNLAPLLKLVGSDPGLLPNYMVSVTGAPYGYWEFDMSMSPVVFGIIIVGVYSFLRKPKKYPGLLMQNNKWIAWIFFIFFTWIAIEFTLAKGWIYPLLQNLPILSSLHVNPRFAAAFLFPLAFIAAVIYNSWAAKWSAKKSLYIFLVVNLVALIPLSTYFMIKTDLQDRLYDITTSQVIYNQIRSGNNLTITGISLDASNTQALLLHESNLQPYEPIFGYDLESFHPEIVPGSVWMVTDGYYNMTNPSGYVFPEVNGTRPFERVKVGDEANLTLFLNHQKTNWKIPVYQEVLDWVSGLTFWFVLALLVLYPIYRVLKSRRARRAA